MELELMGIIIMIVLCLVTSVHAFGRYGLLAGLGWLTAAATYGVLLAALIKLGF
jgi:hypothetical protein